MPTKLPKPALVAAALLIPAAALAASAGTATTGAGVYTVEQARQGAELYAQQCAMCHGKDLTGTYEIVPLKGRFLTYWVHAPLGRLFDYIGRAMPQMAPGTLAPDQNAAIVAYLLEQNGMPAGVTPLVTDAKALDAIGIELPKR